MRQIILTELTRTEIRVTQYNKYHGLQIQIVMSLALGLSHQVPLIIIICKNRCSLLLADT